MNELHVYIAAQHGGTPPLYNRQIKILYAVHTKPCPMRKDYRNSSLLGQLHVYSNSKKGHTTKIGSLAAEWDNALVPFKNAWTRLWRFITGRSNVPSGSSKPSRAFLKKKKNAFSSFSNTLGLQARRVKKGH